MLTPKPSAVPIKGSNKLKLILPLVFIALAVLLFKYLLGSKPAHIASVPKDKATPVQVFMLKSASLSPEIQLRGQFEAPDAFHAAAPGVGWVQAVNVREGSQVLKGDILLTLDARDFTTAVTQAQSELADVDAQLLESEIRNTQNRAALVDERKILTLTRKALARNEALGKRALSSESVLENAQKEMMRQQLAVNKRALEVKSYAAKTLQLEARKRRINAQLAQANRALERSEVVAPFAGVVSAVNIAAGQRVNAGAALVTMYAPDQLEIRGLIPEKYQAELTLALAAKQPLVAVSEQDDQTYILSRLSAQAQTGGVDGFFRAQSNEAGRAQLGALVSLRLKRPEQADLYRIPPAAIYDNNRVYLMRDSKLVAVAVDIVGQVTELGDTFRVVRSAAIGAGEPLVLTRLPNAITGLPVKAIELKSKPDAVQ
ncbi:MAG: biotin/lipoyl-binding protein [Arenicellales bacterium]